MFFIPYRDREGTNSPVSFEQPEHDNLPCSYSATLSWPIPAKTCIIALNRPIERLTVDLLMHPERFSDRSIESFDGADRGRGTESEAVGRDPKRKYSSSLRLADSLMRKLNHTVHQV